jgi:hypothetical protein
MFQEVFAYSVPCFSASAVKPFTWRSPISVWPEKGVPLSAGFFETF